VKKGIKLHQRSEGPDGDFGQTSSQDKSEDERGSFVFELSEKVTDDSENDHDQDIKNLIVHAVRAYQQKRRMKG